MIPIDRARWQEKTVKTQEEFDKIPLNFIGAILIELGPWWKKAIVKNKYARPVNISGEGSVEVYGNSVVEISHNISAKAWDSSLVIAWRNSVVELHDNASSLAYSSAKIFAHDNTSVIAWGKTMIIASNNSVVELHDEASVLAYENSLEELYRNTQVVNRRINEKNAIKNERKVYIPKTIEEFLNFYNIKHTKTKAIFYKLVKKYKGGIYLEKCKCNIEKCDIEITAQCSSILNFSDLWFASHQCEDYSNLVIIEMETKISNMVLHEENSYRCIRTSKVKVLREVPLEEYGISGKILAKIRQ